MTLAPADARSLQDEAPARGGWLLWLVTDAGPDHPGRFVARAHTADVHGGAYLPGALVVDTLVELRGQIPNGLTLRERTPALPPDAIETWD